MSWLKKAFQGAAETFLGTGASEVASNWLGSDPSSSPGGVSWQDQKKAMRWGNQFDAQQYRKLSNWDWQKAQERGLTPQEYYGSSASSGNAGTASTSTLGNAQNQQQMQERGLKQESRERQLDRDTEIKKAAISAFGSIKSSFLGKEAALGSAETSAKASIQVQRMRDRIDQQKIDLSKRELEEITIPAAAAALNKTNKEIKYLVNQIETSTPKWERWRIMTQLGVDNAIQNYILSKAGVNPADPKSVQSLSEEKYQALLTSLLSAKATLSGNIAAIKEIGSELGRVTGKAFDTVMEEVKNLPINQAIRIVLEYFGLSRKEGKDPTPYYINERGEKVYYGTIERKR